VKVGLRSGLKKTAPILGIGAVPCLSWLTTDASIAQTSVRCQVEISLAYSSSLSTGLALAWASLKAVPAMWT
jgi:hypothetical protein